MSTAPVIELDLKPVVPDIAFQQAPPGTLARREPSRLGVNGLHPTQRAPTPQFDVIEGEYRTVYPEPFETRSDYATRARNEWARSDEQYVRDLQRLDETYDSRQAEIEAYYARQRRDLQRQREALNPPHRGGNLQNWQRNAERIGAGVAGIADFANRRSQGQGLAESALGAAGTVAGGYYGGNVGARAGGTAGLAAGFNPATAAVAGAVGGAAGAIGGAAVGGAIGGWVGRQLDNLADWLMPDPETSSDRDVSEIEPGVPTYDPNIPGAFEGGQCAGVRYSFNWGYFNGQSYSVDPNSRSLVGPFRLDDRSYTQGTSKYWRIYAVSEFDGQEIPAPANGTSSITETRTVNPVNVRRADGLADTCGNHPGYMPVSPSTRAPAIGLPGIGLPGIEVPDFPVPFTEAPLPGPIESPEPKPEPELPENPLPTPPPDLFGESPTGFDEPTARPDLDPESEPSSSGNGNETPESNCDICAKLDEILSYFNAEYTIQGTLANCNPDTEPVTINSGQILTNKTAFAAIAAQNQALMDAIEEIWDRVKCDQDVSAVFPDWWQVRVGADRPQLVVLYGEVDSQGHLSSSRWSLHVPWFDPRFRHQLKKLLPKYSKGNWQGMITLRDNSKIIVYGSTQSQAEITVKSLSKLCLSHQLPSPLTVKIGQTKGPNFKQVKVAPVRASYFPTGQQDNRPEWIEDLK
jgi:hypothetical protein